MAGKRVRGTVLAMNAHLLHTMRELHSRINDGIHVRLLWRKDDERVVVAVDDAKTDSFVLDVHPGERAMDVFEHPYAYAAWHRVPMRPAPLALAA